MELTDVTVATVVETLWPPTQWPQRRWPLPLLLSAHTDWGRWLKVADRLTEAMELTDVLVVTVVETQWPLALLLSVCVHTD